MWCIMKTLLDILSLLYSIFTTKRQCGRARKLIDYGMNITNFFMKSNYDLASADIASMSIPAVWTIATHTWANKHLSFASWAAIGPIAAWERKKLMGSGPWKRCSQKNKKRIIVPSSFMDQKNVMGWNRLKIGFACIFQS